MPLPPRVISLVPSATDLLCAIGARPLLVGRSHECEPPHGPLPTHSGDCAEDATAAGASLLALPIVTGQRTAFSSAAGVDADVRRTLESGHSLYTIDEAKLRALAPTLIVTQDLCSVCSIDLASVERVARTLDPAPALVSLNPHTFEDVLDDAFRLGRALDDLEGGGRWTAHAARLVSSLRERMYAGAEYVNPFTEGPVVAFLEWTDPLFVGGHWTPQLIERAGGRHPLNPTSPIDGAGAADGPIGQTLRRAGKSIAIPPAALAAVRPDALIVCPCGVPLDQARREVDALAEHDWFTSLPAVRSGRVAIADGRFTFTRPGPGLVDAFEFLVGWLNGVPSLIPSHFPWSPWRPRHVAAR